MRTVTRTERIGENMGPIDWSYDFRSHFDSHGTDDAGKQRRCDEAMAKLRLIEERMNADLSVRATTDGGWPRCGIHRVVEVGMYDGWPYWKPTPSVCLQGHYGCEWATFSQITDVYTDEGRR